MTDYKNAELLRHAYLNNPCNGSSTRNICRGQRNWNVCDYGDVYAGNGLECWKQGGDHWCVHCERITMEAGTK